jgi:hypothetical protein
MYVEAQADDPQGVDSLASAGHLLGAYVPDGTEVFNEALVACSPEGLCVGSFRDGDFGAVGCATAADYEFRITIYDEDGNASLPFALSQL